MHKRKVRRNTGCSSFVFFSPQKIRTQYPKIEYNNREIAYDDAS
jgi:hypothetical protein